MLGAVAGRTRHGFIRRKNRIIIKTPPQGDGLSRGRIVGRDGHRRQPQWSFDLDGFANRHGVSTAGRGRCGLVVLAVQRQRTYHRQRQEQNGNNFARIHEVLRVERFRELEREIKINSVAVYTKVSRFQPFPAVIAVTINRDGRRNCHRPVIVFSWPFASHDDGHAGRRPADQL